jgi:dihydrolipoamide dehydrogenase
MNKTYDIIIIGAGPGGYAAAIRAADLGLKACVIEKGLVGGTCLNWGCIPTKALARSTDCLFEAKHSSKFGIDIKSFDVDFAKISDRKDHVVNTLRSGAESMLRIKKVDTIKAEAIFAGPRTVKAGDDTFQAEHIVIAAGSVPAELEALKFDHNNIVSSKDLLFCRELPKRMVIIGGGFIGCEFASIYNLLGVEITIIEIASQLIPGMDKEISKRLETALIKSGIKVMKNESVLSADIGKSIRLDLASGNSMECDKVLLCVGTRPDTKGLNLESAGVKTEKGFIYVDEKLRTSAAGIYAVGDVISGYPLAHVASYEGILAVDNIKGAGRKADYSAIPSAVFTHPEIATVGKSADELRSQGLDVKEAKLPFTAVSKAHIHGDTEGLVKFVYEVKTKKIMGAAIMGHCASEIISNFTIAIQNNLTVDDLSHTIFAHPTLSESVLDAVRRV